MRAAVSGPADGLCMVLRHPRSGPHGELRAVSRADNEAPGVGRLACWPVGPTIGLGVPYGVLDGPGGVPSPSHVDTLQPVSYTHLDVYKRQPLDEVSPSSSFSCFRSSRRGTTSVPSALRTISMGPVLLALSLIHISQFGARGAARCRGPLSGQMMHKLSLIHI